MKIALWSACLALLLSGCEGWPLSTKPYIPPTAVPSRTPSVWTATPIILSPVTDTATAAAKTPTVTLVQATETESPTPTATNLPGAVSAAILGCDTSIDIVHSMGEVTNAYVKVTNTTANEVPDVCATLYALDEGRPHPDKKKCLPWLPAGYEVTLKLTVDSTYQKNSPVQVDLTSSGMLAQRVGEAACTALAVLPLDTDLIGTPRAIP